LGSVAERVVREAGCPVLTTRMAPEPPSSTTRNAFDRILCPIDFEESSFKALDLAGRIAAQTAAKLYLLHVCPTLMIPLGGPTTVQVMEEQSAKQKLREIAGLHLRDARYELLVTTGDAAESVTSLQTGLDARPDRHGYARATGGYAIFLRERGRAGGQRSRVPSAYDPAG
jgi:nucleotide-binding universal stress UspA family protein